MLAPDTEHLGNELMFKVIHSNSLQHQSWRPMCANDCYYRFSLGFAVYRNDGFSFEFYTTVCTLHSDLTSDNALANYIICT